ncbi:MAG: right-handed parallel beta-helix repeat-containing protein [Patescibacteria group bacterium]
MEIDYVSPGSWVGTFEKYFLMDPTIYTYWVEGKNESGATNTSEIYSINVMDADEFVVGGGYGSGEEEETIPPEELDPNCTTTVPANHSSIQSAINASNDGDTICVEAGTYYENLVMDGRTINLQSLDGADVTTLDGMDIASTISVLNGSNGLIDGFTIQNGYDGFGLGGGIAIDGSSPTVQHSRITSNTFNGIDITNNSNPIIQNSVISDNMFNGVHVTDSSEPTLNNLTIVENWTAGVRSELNSNVTINNSVIVDNFNEGLGNDIGSTLVGDYNNVSGNAWGNYDVGVVAGVGSISSTPDFVDQTWFRLDAGSAGIDQGNPSAVVNDSNGTRNDMGTYGGPNGNW